MAWFDGEEDNPMGNYVLSYRIIEDLEGKLEGNWKEYIGWISFNSVEVKSKIKQLMNKYSLVNTDQNNEKIIMRYQILKFDQTELFLDIKAERIKFTANKEETG